MTRVGVVDVGTNSVCVLVADVDLEVRDVVRDLVITRLGEGVDATRTLAPAALRRTVAAVAAFAERCRAERAEAIVVAATSAVRDAANREEFLAAVHRATGIDARVLSGDEEAHLAFRGATIGVEAQAPSLVVDIGGGSTEIVAGSTSAERWISLDVGSVRLTERHVSADPPAAGELEAVRVDARAAIGHAAAVMDTATGATMIGVAGTVTTIAAIALGLERYDRARVHGATLSRGTVAEIGARLASMTREARAALPVMPAGREDVIVAGAVILEEVMRAASIEACIVSESDILDGMAVSIARG